MFSQTRPWILAGLAALAASGPVAGRAQSPAPPTKDLFVAESAAAPLATPPDEPAATVRARRVRVHTDRFDDTHLTLNLFAGLTLRAVRADSDPPGGEVWAGQVEGDPLSSVTFVHRGTLVQGAVRTSASAYSVEPIGDGPEHVVRQVPVAPPAVELPPLVPPIGPPMPAQDSQPRAFDHDGVVDILVVYTAAARQQAGGSDAAVQARIALGIAEMNTALANSQVAERVRLVGAELVGYRDAGDLAEDLQRLTSPADGFMDQVHARRTASGADVVSLIVGSTAGGACGVAWVMQTVSTTFAPYAFNVTAYPCISPNYTFAHEIAHNMGTAHAPEDPNAPPVFPYAYGYKDPQRLFRTVMAYDCIGGCPRVLHFSNPAATFGGKPTGTAELQDNALALNQTGWTVANFYQSRPDGTALTAPLDPQVDAVGTTATVSWTRPVSGTPTRYVVEVGRDEGFSDVATFVVSGLSTTFVQSDVVPGAYHVRVRAYDAYGPGPPSSNTFVVMTATGRCLSPADSPVLANPVVAANAVQLFWQPAQSGGPIDRYLVGVGSRPDLLDVAVVDTGSSTPSVAATAAPGVYFVRVAGVNPCGVGAPSNLVGVAVGPPVPGPPGPPSVQVDATRRVTLAWQPSAVGGTPTRFIVEAGTRSGVTDVAVLATFDDRPVLVVQAAPGRYVVRVRAVNAHGTSVASEEVVVVVL